MAFLRSGLRVEAVSPPGHPLRFVSGVAAQYAYRGLDSAASLRTAILASDPDLIVPCDDGVVWQLHELHGKEPTLRPLIERSLGSREAYPILQSRARVLETAAELGIRAPLTQSVASEADLRGWASAAPAVLKLDGTWGGEGVAIARSPAEAVAAFRKLSKPYGAGLAWKRFLVNRDPLALWSWHRRANARVTVQAFVAGRPANAMIACLRGEVLGVVTVEVLASQGATGAATVVRLVENREIERAARLLAGRLQLSGFHGLDFMIEDATGDAYFIELNPRCTQLGHLRLEGSGDLAGDLAGKLWKLAVPEPAVWMPDCARGSTVAFFPQTLNWNPKSEYLHRGFHDVPWEEPALVRELLRPAWPERQWLSRIYHHFRTPKRPPEMMFPDRDLRFPCPSVPEEPEADEDETHALESQENPALKAIRR